MLLKKITASIIEEAMPEVEYGKQREFSYEARACTKLWYPIRYSQFIQAVQSVQNIRYSWQLRWPFGKFQQSTKHKNIERIYCALDLPLNDLGNVSILQKNSILVSIVLQSKRNRFRKRIKAKDQ